MRKVTRTKPTPTIVEDERGKKSISTKKWNTQLVVQYVIEDGGWKTVAELANFVGWVAYLYNLRRVRARITLMVKMALAMGKFLVVEKDLKIKNHPVGRVKVWDGRNGDERTLVCAYIEKLEKRNDLTSEQYEQALDLLTAVDSQIDDK